MNRLRHITLLLAALLTVLSAVTCSRQNFIEETEIPELQVSLYIPGSTMTKADTELDPEKKVTSLRVWAFLSSNGTLVSYKNFTTGLNESALPNNTVTRFGLPLTDEMFKILTTESGSPAARPTVDVYAIANAESACTTGTMPGQQTSRATLDQLTLNNGFSGSELTTAVPETGLPMSGVLKGASVTGGYPVLNISTLTLTRAVSKIRFVFCQQKNPETGLPTNNECAIVRIDFDQTAQIASKEKLFTTNTTASGYLFDIGTDEDRYCALEASLTGQNGNPLIPNSNLSLVEEPEDLAFRSLGHDLETVERYEARLNEAVDASSQAGPIYLCETDQRISGTITYRTNNDGPDQTVSFSMEEGTLFPRNHSWIVYACFAEETMSLQLKVLVSPWEWSEYHMDFSVNSVNVIRRFTVFDTNPKTFDKVQSTDGFYDIAFWHTVDNQANIIHGDIIIATPVGGILHIIPVPGALDGYDKISNAIQVSPSSAIIYPNQEEGTVESCRIPIEIKCNPNLIVEDPDHPELSPGYQLIGNYVDLHFSVEIGEGLGFVDLDSESIDRFRFIIWEDWTNWHLKYVNP